MKRKKNFMAAFTTDNRVHFYYRRIGMFLHICQKILKRTSFKNTRIFDFGIMDIPNLIGNFFRQINVPDRKSPQVNVIIDGLFRGSDPGMIFKYRIRRLFLTGQRRNLLIQDLYDYTDGSCCRSYHTMACGHRKDVSSCSFWIRCIYWELH